MVRFNNINIAWLIHAFALLHAAVTIVCRYIGVNDELLLTILTMTMILLICVKRWLSIDFAAAYVIMANILGYILGNLGANILQPLIGTSPFANAVSTALTTELLGWTILGITKVFKLKSKSEELTLTSPQLQWLLVAVAGIFIFRIIILFLFASGPFKGTDIIEAGSKLFSNSAALITMIALNLLYVRWFSPRFEKKLLKNGKKGKSRQIAVLTAFILGVALLETVLTGILPFRKNPEFQHDFPILFVTSVIIEIAVYCLVYVINYALKAGNEVKEAIGLANVAQYRYFKLKHQVNPHFLFNSLNILDCLVCEQKTEEASTYIHKLAGLYRYMLKTEDTQLVTLQDELDFASRYIELLLVRFPEGLKVITDIPEDSLKRNVVPCSLQLLIENATKHNAISREHPLIINISAIDGYIKVSNEIIPKISQSPSSGLGLKYMRQQYFDLSGKDIDIQHTDNTFTVTIPLI